MSNLIYVMPYIIRLARLTIYSVMSSATAWLISPQLSKPGFQMAHEKFIYPSLSVC